MLLLLVTGGLFGLLFALNTLLQTIRRAPRIGFWHTLLAFLAALLPLVALVAGLLNGHDIAPVRDAARALAALLGMVGLVAAVLELRRPERLKGSRGLLSLGVAALLALSTLTVPASATALLVTPTPFKLPTVTPTLLVTATLARSPVPSVTAMPTATHTPRPTATPTRPAFATRTPTPSPTQPIPCTAVTLYNLNLRAAPTADTPILLTIPYNTTVAVYGRTADSSWWLARYEDVEGWLDGQYLRLDSDCTALPVWESAP